MQGTVWYIKYRTTNGGTTVEIIIHASKAGSAVLAGDIVGVLPADAHQFKFQFCSLQRMHQPLEIKDLVRLV